MSEHLGNGMNYLCPRCKTGDKLSIEITVWATLVPDGTDIEGQDHEWDDASKVMCKGKDSCNWTGIVGDLIQLPEGEGKMYACADCDMEFHENQGDEVTDALERFITGDTYTDVQCPSCGALAFPIE